MNYIIFGAGQIGLEAIELIGKEKISYFIDNDVHKINSEISNKMIYSFKEGIEKRSKEIIVIAVSATYEEQIEDQLKNNDIKDYCFFSELKMQMTRDKILTRTNYLSIYNNAIQWIKNNSVLDQGIINNSKLKKSYPEVTGYYIPTLIRWGYKELAVSYAKWLCSIQKEDGSWYDTLDKAPYIFDSAQILKGLIAVREMYSDREQLDSAIKRGCDWILSCMTDEGQLKTPSEAEWGNVASELIHTYCLSPLNDAAQLYGEPKYQEAANKILNYYKQHYFEKIVDFSMLSHFYAYVVEAMLDMGEIELAREAMTNIEAFQKKSGAVPAYKDVDWICSTGLFQLSLIWFRLGDLDRGNKAFEYACKLQNDSGGWYGSYISEENSDEINTYFPDAEISWANKYFLDALYYKNVCQFEKQSVIFRNDLEDTDGKYLVIKNTIENLNNETSKILDLGCGKGRYLRKLLKNFPKCKYYGTDISLKVMKYFEDCGQIETRQGSLTDIPYENDMFDVVYTCEALEHAIDIESAVKEMARVIKPAGKMIIIDKNKDMYGYFEIEDWEQWFDKDELREIMLRYCTDVNYIPDLNYDNQDANGLFGAWIGTVK